MFAWMRLVFGHFVATNSAFFFIPSIRKYTSKGYIFYAFACPQLFVPYHFGQFAKRKKQNTRELLGKAEKLAKRIN